MKHKNTNSKFKFTNINERTEIRKQVILLLVGYDEGLVS